MATPTASRLPQAQAVATPPVSTPFSGQTHPAFSPHGPRSVVPSPAQQFKRSPANSNTLYGHGTNSSFGAAGYDSPGTAMALGVPGAIGIDLGGLEMGALGHGAAGLGARNDEEDRRLRLQTVVDILKTNKGRLSEAGIERLARRIGLDPLWEDQMGTAGNMRTLIIAGTAFALDVDFSKNVVKKVALSFPESPEIVTRHAEKAGNVLLRDLQFAPNESPLTKMLDRFASNLERLATLDKLSVIPSLNCHEAIAGIYESLDRLHKWEVARLREQEENTEEAVLIRKALCGKSGKPVMHSRDRIGLSLDYWRERRSGTAKTTELEQPPTWSILVDCAPLPILFAPLRVSEKWISPEIQKAEPAAEDLFITTADSVVLDWLEPDATLLPSPEPPKEADMEGIEQTPKYPEVMFVARFDPPVVVPYQLAAQIYNSTSAEMDMYQQSTFDGLVFPYGPKDKIEPGEPRTIQHRATISLPDKDREESTRTHKNTLFIEKIDFGRTLIELPFSHPRQLVEMLPSLRQYAFLLTLLRKAFSFPIADEKEEEIKPVKSKKALFSDFMSRPPTFKGSPLPVDVSLTISPLPRLQVVFPFKGRTANVTFDIKLNGLVEVVEQNVMELQDMDEEMVKKKTESLGKMLEIAEDLGVWVEYLKMRFE